MNDDLIAYRVWPDGTTQEWSDTPHSHMSDDYARVLAVDADSAERAVNGPRVSRQYVTRRPWFGTWMNCRYSGDLQMFWVRFGGDHGPGFRFTKEPPIFSERMGLMKPLFQAFGFRWFWLPRTPPDLP